jgi:hypothetical protein
MVFVKTVSPVFRLTVTKKIQLPSAGFIAASIAMSPGLAIGPTGKPSRW